MNQIELFGVVILEPIVSLTDLITSVVSIVLASLLWNNESQHKSKYFFTYYFLFLGIATLCAATIGHAFLYYIDSSWKAVGWCFSAIGIYFFERASLDYFEQQLKIKVYNSLIIVVNIQLILFFILMVFPSIRSFKLIQLNATFSYILIIVPLYLYAIYQWKIKTAWFVIIAIAQSVVIGIVYNAQITIHQWFNHDSLAHTMMAIYLLLMYYAIKKLLAREV